MNPNIEHNPVERKSQNHKYLSFVSFFSSLMLIFSFAFYLYTAFSNEEKLFAIDSFLGFTTEYTSVEKGEMQAINIPTKIEIATENSTDTTTISEATTTSKLVTSLTTSTTDSLLAALRGTKVRRAASAPVPAPIPTPTPAPLPSQTPSPALQSPTPTITSLNYKFGFSIGDDLPAMTDAQIAKILDDFVYLGIGWVRLDFSWSDVQHDSTTQYRWTDLDRIVLATNKRNLKLLPVLGFTPGWAKMSGCSGTINCAPENNAQFAKFASEAVKRYSSQGIHSWEIWNEPNLGDFWLPSGDTARYAALLKETSIAIRAVDSSAIIITGGMGPAATDSRNTAPRDFLEQLYASGARNYFDAVGNHPYSYPVPASITEDWNAWAQMSISSRSLRSIMNANGDNAKTIWLTEYGAPTGGPTVAAEASNYHLNLSPTHVTEELQSVIMGDAIQLVKTYSWAGPMFWHTYKDLGTDQITNENFFGVLRVDGTAKPSYTQLKTSIAQ